MMRSTARKTWKAQLRETKTIEALQCGRPDRVQLQVIQESTNNTLKAPALLSIRRDLEPGTKECDVFITTLLEDVKGQLYVHQAGVISCLHILSYDAAREQIVAVRPDPDKADEFFEARVSAYLQCIILAPMIRPVLCSEAEKHASLELFRALPGRADELPSIIRLLQAVGQKSCEEFLPLNLVRKVLQDVKYGERLEVELRDLSRNRQWYRAVKLVHGLRMTTEYLDTQRLLPYAIPNHRMWVVWKPNIPRLKNWDEKLLPDHRQHLLGVLDLEGPDTTEQLLPALRSSPLSLQKVGLRLDFDDSFAPDRLLNALDRAIEIGSHAVDLYIWLCIKQRTLDWTSFRQLEAVLELQSHTAAEIFSHYIRTIRTDSTANDMMQAFTAVLPLLKSSLPLQAVFGTYTDFAPRVSAALSRAQMEFCQMLALNQPSERYGLKVHAFGRALLNADWLSDKWQPSYIEMLRQFPEDAEIKRIFRAFETSQGNDKQHYMDVLAARIGASRRRDQTTTTELTVSLHMADEIWHDDLDVDRASLRRSLRSLNKIDPSLATSCLKQSLAERDIFVRELVDIIRGDTDQVCVNMAHFLGPREAEGYRVDDAWKSLLMQMMRSRPPRLLDRCGTRLPLESWESWIRNLNWIYRGRHLDPEGGLGITNEKINRWTQRKAGIGRSVSASTTSTGATGSSTISDMSDFY